MLCKCEKRKENVDFFSESYAEREREYLYVLIINTTKSESEIRSLGRDSSAPNYLQEPTLGRAFVMM